MAGHSQFKNIMHRKGAQDKKRARAFSRLAREIAVAARQGLPQIDANPRLRSAVAAARAANMPKDNIERAIAKAAAGEGAGWEEVRYEGYGPGGAAVLVEALTDNRNRTASELRVLFAKGGGALAASGSVAFLFERVAELRVPSDLASYERALEAAIEAGAEDCEADGEGSLVTAPPERLAEVRDALEAALAPGIAAELVWRPLSRQAIGSEEEGRGFLALLEALEESEDVRRAYDNAELAPALLALLEAEA